MSKTSDALDNKELRVKRALLYQLSYAPTPSQDNTSIPAAQVVAEHNGLGSITSGDAVNSVVLSKPFRAHDYPEIVKAAEECVPEEITPDPWLQMEPDPEPTSAKSKRRRAWINGRACVRCGATKHLQLDHIDRAAKEIEAAAIFGMSPDNPKAIKELEKCQVLCKRCHRHKTVTEMGWR